MGRSNPHGAESRSTSPRSSAPTASCDQLVGAAYDVSEHRRIEAELAHRTRHDPLTELPEPRDARRVAAGRARARATDDARVGLVILDIDHFKVVNDSLGHEAGDELLATAASRLDRVLRAGDRLARLGGDELAVVCHNVASVDDVLALAHRLRAVFDEPFALGDDEVYLGASVGVVVSDGPDDTPTRLLRDADVAVFAAKELGRGRVELFDDDDARPGRPPARDRERPAARARARRVPRALPAGRRVRPVGDDRHRGARALGAPRARACSRPPTSSRSPRRPG